MQGNIKNEKILEPPIKQHVCKDDENFHVASEFYLCWVTVTVKWLRETSLYRHGHNFAHAKIKSK